VKAAVVTRFGPPEVLRIQEVETPEIDDEHVLVKVRAIGLNFADILCRIGVYPSVPHPPFIPGLEFSGTVERTGSHVKGFKKGDRVISFSRLGVYAEFVCVHHSRVMKMPAGMDFTIGASIGVTYLTAYHGLMTLANIRSGEKLLLHAAAGGVGTATIQIARHLGVEIFGTASSAEKLQVAARQGMHHGINYRTGDFEHLVRQNTLGYGVDVVMDSVGGSVMRKSWRLLAPMGRYVLYGFASVAGKRGLNYLKALKEIAATPVIFPPLIVSKNIGFFGFNLYFLFQKVDYLRSASQQVFDWYKKKIVRPVIGATFSFDRIAEAHALLQSRKSFGKVVIVL